MSRRNVDDMPLPEYEVGQYFPRRESLSAEEQRRLTQRYGYVRAAFHRRQERYGTFQRYLNQARMGRTYDVYLTRSVYLALGAGALGVVVGLFVTLWFGVDVLSTGSSPYSAVGLAGAALVALSVGGLLATATWLGRYYYPRTVAQTRGRSIDILLPHAIVYMYALSYGGTNVVETMRSIAGSPDYGEVSREFDAIVRDMDLFGNDLFTALRNARNLTPSTNFEQFLDDLLSVLDSGGDVTLFLDSEAKTYTREAMEEQEDFLETLSVFSEIFIAAFVAAPLLLIVTLMVISFLGGQTLSQLYLLTYVVFPVGMTAFLTLVHVLSKPYAQPEVGIDRESTATDDVRAAVRGTINQSRRELRRFWARVREWQDGGWDLGEPVVQTDGGAVATRATALDDADPRFDSYHRNKAVDAFARLLGEPLTLLRRQPLLTLVVTVPVAAVALAVAVATGAATPTLDALFASPVRTTMWFFVLPFFVVAGPVSAFHEIQRRRDQTLEQRFPDTLNLLSSANQMGIALPEALALVARWSSGVLADELGKLRNDITWNYDVDAALTSFANRLGISQLTRIVRLVAIGAQSSGDLSRILSVAAEDTRTRSKLERARRRAMSSYVAIVLIGYLVYLFVILMLTTSYLAPLEALPSLNTDGASLPVSVSGVPIQSYRAIFFHSVLIQGIGSGLLAGKLADNDALSGLKYGLGLVLLALCAFLFI